MRSARSQAAAKGAAAAETPAARKTRLFLEAQGRKRGRVEGRAEGTQHALLTLLHARGIPPSTQDEARIRACTDSAWTDRGFVTGSAAQKRVNPASGRAPERRFGGLCSAAAWTLDGPSSLRPPGSPPPSIWK